MAEENKNKYIFNVSDATKEAIARKSAQYLPDNPSARGMTADQIRKAFYAPVTDTAQSVLAELDLVIDAVDAAIVAEEEARIAAIDDANAQTQKVAADLADEVVNRKNAEREHGVEYRALVRRVVDEEEATAAANTRFTALETAVSGKARSYVLEDWEDLKDLLTGRVEIGTNPYYADDLLTGDNILIVQKDVPDFWFEATTDTDRPVDTYTYTDEDGNEQTVYLRVLGYDNGGTQVGILHILESDYTVIEGYAKAASTAAEEAKAALGDVGDLDAALDKIIELQESLIGGAV